MCLFLRTELFVRQRIALGVVADTTALVGLVW